MIKALEARLGPLSPKGHSLADEMDFLALPVEVQALAYRVLASVVAEQTLRDAQSDHDLALSAARDEGYEEGHADAADQYGGEIEDLKAEINALTAQLEKTTTPTDAATEA